jgi:uncharacterized membrane protein YphA (DoxX/SURF4 family)
VIKRLWSDLPKQHVHLASFVLRLGLGAIFIFHGLLKLSQDYGAHWSDRLPAAQQIAVAWGETICGFALFLGLLSRLAAVGPTIIMIGAIVLQTDRYHFINIEYNPNDPTRIPTGWEYNFALIVMCLTVIALGSGKVSLDYLIFNRFFRARTPQPVPTHVPGRPTVAPA